MANHYFWCRMVLLDYSKEYLTVIKIQDTNLTPDKVLNILLQPIDRLNIFQQQCFTGRLVHHTYKHDNKAVIKTNTKSFWQQVLT